MKPPDDPTPSGDRRLARLMQRALDRAGYAVFLASRLRTRDGLGDETAQARLAEAAEAEGDRLIAALAPDPPRLWFTYHCFYKAPDLIGPRVAAALGMPYVVAEGTRARKRLTGPWAGFAAASEAALDRAAVIFWLTERDRPALEAARPAGQRLVHLPPFAALGEAAARPVSTTGPLRLAAVAMMRRPDKLASFAALAAALGRLEGVDWRLTVAGGGPAEAETRALLAPFGDRVTWAGRQDAREDVHAVYEACDLFVWPGVNEGFGMVYLEAQAAGRAVVAEDRPGVREVVAPSSALVPPGDADAFAFAIRRYAEDRAGLAAAGAAARAHMLARHGIEAA
ncbi:MAG: glycosyltransferase, partial [Rhodobacteraceae bacterium]